MHLSEIKALIGNTADASFAVDGLGCVAAWNGAAEAMFALAARDAIGRPCNEIVQGADECGPVCSAHCTIQQAVRKNRPIGNFDLQVQTANGMRWCNVSVLSANVETNTNPYAIHIVRQIDARKRLEMLVRDFAVTGVRWPDEQATVQNSSNRSPDSEPNLSDRERDVLKLLAKGVTTAATAEQLHISRATVNNHVQHILQKLNSHTRLEAIRRAERAGLI